MLFLSGWKRFEKKQRGSKGIFEVLEGVSMRKIATFCGSIVDCPTAAIVNAANSKLALGSGVSGAIRDACGGKEFQDECIEAVEDQAGGNLDLSGVAMTSGGSSQYKWILHAATLDFSKGQYTSKEVAKKCMLNALKVADEIVEENDLDKLSIGVPLFGSDVGGLSVTESCEAMCAGMKTFFKGCPDSLINQIVFVHPKNDVIRQVRLILSRHFVLN